jgi:acyl-coenzyme A thioesterase PaaI-like protein
MDSKNLEKEDFFQKHMPENVCFGCGQDNTQGLQIHSSWDHDECVCIWQPDTKYQGWPQLTCGGIIATLIDCHCMASAMATAVKNEGRELGSEPQYRFATGTLNIKFIKPTPVTVPLILRARAIRIKDERIYTLHCNLYADNELTVEAEVIAFLVYRSDEHNSGRSAFS